jgi:hypothetical protein
MSQEKNIITPRGAGMCILTLKRTNYIEDGTFGVLCDEGDIPFAVTLEPEWRDNKANSCIPEGEYVCKRSHYHRGGYDTYEILVEGRSRILFHKGNIEDHSLGCILIGEQFEHLKGKTAILRSGKGFSEFMGRLNNVMNFKLIIPKLYFK